MKLLTFSAALLWLPLTSAATTTSIRISKACITTGRPFVVNITNANPLPDDWVVIVPASQSTSTLARPAVGWDFACGTQSCSKAISSGFVSIQANVAPGLYKAVLSRNGVKTFQALAVSQTFRVVTSGNACFAKVPTKPTTPPPTMAPKPVAKGTVTPPPVTGLVTSVVTDKSFYSAGEPIKVSFTSSMPKNNDFLAIFEAATSNQNLLTGDMWLFTCGRQGSTACPTALAQGTVVFGSAKNAGNWGQGWPLTTGQYVVYLLRFSFIGPFTSVAQSGVFTVQGNEAPGSPQAARAAVIQARSVIANMVFQNKNLTAKFLRMGFHDCIGGCDGCIDLKNPENNGLEFPIDVLEPVVQQFSNSHTGLSRADIWALAAITGVDVAGHGVTTKPISFTMNWYGRVDCEVANKVCRNGQGVSVPCTAKQGPARNPPVVNLNSTGVMQYFKDNFNFTQRQTIAIMGAHTVGSLRRAESGIDGPHGWTVDNLSIHNEYYNALIGAAATTSTDPQIFSTSPGWKRIFLNNTGLGVPNRNFWRLNLSGIPLTMTNADISLVRELSASNMNSQTGQVNCAFRPHVEAPNVPLCPVAESTFQTVAAFKNDNDLFLAEFKEVLELVLTNKYKKDSCGFPLCNLKPF